MSVAPVGEVVRLPLTSPGASDAAGLAAVARRLSVARTFDEIMDVVTHAVRTILKADGATFVLRDGDRCFYAEEDAISPLWKGRRFPMSACISGWCMTRGQAVAIPDIYQDPRIPADAYRPTFVRSLAMAPVRLEHPIAAIGAYWSERREIASAEVDVLQAIANSAALALANMRLRPDWPSGRAGKAQQGSAPAARPPIGVVIERIRREGLRPNSPGAYAFAVFCVTVATMARWTVGAESHAPGLVTFTTYYPAVLIALLVGGARAGALAAILGAVCAYLFFMPPYFRVVPLTLSEALNLSLYLFSSGLIIFATERYRRSVARLSEEEARHLLLARELQHRAGNTLAIIQSIVTQSLPGDPDKAKAILQRVRAAVSADILGDKDRGPISLCDQLAGELEPLAPGRISMHGADVMLGGKARAMLALAVHELATNAAKYGAFSTPEGRVAISWTPTDGAVRILWVESGGPPVAPPKRRGFGSALFRRLVEAGGGSVTMEFMPDGLRALICLPLEPRRRG